MFLIKGLLVIFWFTLIPYLIGGIIVSYSSVYENHRLLRYFSGLLSMFSISLLLTLLWTFRQSTLTSLCISFAVICLLLSLISLVKYKSAVWGDLKKCSASLRCKIGEHKISFWMFLAFVMILFQMFAASYLAHFDADDSFYVATATTSVHTDTVFQYSAYTGFRMESLPARYVLSPFPIFLAIISRLSLNLHAAIIAHMFFPALFIGMAYLVYAMFAKRWFSDQPDGQGIFLLLCSVVIFFSCYARHLTGTVMLIRIWQGKAFLASVIVPLLFYECMVFMVRDHNRPQDIDEPEWKKFRILFLTGLGACLLTSMAVALVPLIILGSAVIACMINKSCSVIPKAIVCCIPQMLLGICYVMIR